VPVGSSIAAIAGSAPTPAAVAAASGLRHTHASQLNDAGIDIVMISKRLGHSKPDITLRVYAHLFRKDDSKAADAIDAALAAR
jgi:integrase